MHILRSKAVPPPWQVAWPASRAERFVRRCGRPALAPESLEALRVAGADLSPTEWEEVRQLADQNGMEPLVFKHLAQADLLAAAPPAVVATLKASYCATLLTNRRFQREL